MKRAKLKKSR